jgi:hypothetical protein
MTVVEADSSLFDFYDSYKPFEVTRKDTADYEKYLVGLSSDELALIKSNLNYYQIRFKNIGGLVMPLVLEFEFENGDKTIERIPAEIWRYNTKEISKIFVFEKELRQVVLDPYRELIDADYDNNLTFAPASFDKIELTIQRKQPPNIMRMNLKTEKEAKNQVSSKK